MKVEKILSSDVSRSVSHSAHQLLGYCEEFLFSEEIVHNDNSILSELLHFGVREEVPDLDSGLEIVAETKKYCKPQN